MNAMTVINNPNSRVSVALLPPAVTSMSLPRLLWLALLWVALDASSAGFGQTELDQSCNNFSQPFTVTEFLGVTVRPPSRAQSFTVGKTGQLVMLDIQAGWPRTNALAGEMLYVTLSGTTATGEPDENQLLGSVILTNQVANPPTSPNVLVDITHLNVMVRPGMRLAVQLQASIGIRVAWQGQQGNPYAEGAAYAGTPPFFNAIPGVDLAMKTYVKKLLPPIITTQPQDQSVAQGASATFRVVATGASDYQWKENQIDIPGQTRDTLVLSNVQVADSGKKYSVEVKNSGGSVTSSEALLTVRAAVPQNDDCANAVAITVGAVCGSTQNATASGLGTLAPKPCGGSQNSPDVWYTFTPAQSGTFTVSTVGMCPGQTPFDTVLSIYTGQCGLLRQILCNDNASAGAQSEITIPNAVGGALYWIRVSGANGAVGEFQLSLTATASPPPNDVCNSALNITAGVHNFDTSLATTDTLINCQMDKNVWFKYTSASTGTVSLDTCGTSFDTVLAVFDGSCNTLNFIDCNDDASNGPCSGTAQSAVSFSAVAGREYLICVGGSSGDPTNRGPGRITLRDQVALPNNCPPQTGIYSFKVFQIIGSPTGARWAWAIQSPGCANVYVPSVPGVSAGDENSLAAAFVASLKAACPGGIDARTFPSGPGMPKGVFGVGIRCGAGANWMLLVGPENTPTSQLCVAAHFSPSGIVLPTSGPCSFNPTIYEVRLDDSTEIGVETLAAWTSGKHPPIALRLILTEDGARWFYLPTEERGTGEEGVDYCLESTSDLKNWTMVQCVKGSGTTQILIDESAKDRVQFYRVSYRLPTAEAAVENDQRFR